MRYQMTRCGSRRFTRYRSPFESGQPPAPPRHHQKAFGNFAGFGIFTAFRIFAAIRIFTDGRRARTLVARQSASA